MLFMPVRHSSPLGGRKRSAMLRTVAGPSVWKGMPPASANRPTTGTRPGLKTAAFESAAASPLLSNQPVTQTPFAWLRREPGGEAVATRERRHHPVLVQPVWREPAARTGECPGHAQHHRSNRAQSD